MVTIGEFARTTGLTVKALRHYDELGLLVPAAVDPVSRHRHYSGGQLHDGVLIRALRAAEVPLGTVRAALAAESRVGDLLADFRAEIAVARAAQDRALAAVDRLAQGFDHDVTIREREVAATAVVAVVMTLPADEQSASEAEDVTTAAYYELFAELDRRGCAVAGPGWTQFDAVDGDTELVEVALCWPVSTPPVSPPTEVGGVPVRLRERDAVRELVVRMDCGDDAVAPEGLPHPALVALMAELARRGTRGGVDDIGSIRQFVAPDANGRMIVELAVPIG